MRGQGGQTRQADEPERRPRTALRERTAERRGGERRLQRKAEGDARAAAQEDERLDRSERVVPAGQHGDGNAETGNDDAREHEPLGSGEAVGLGTRFRGG